ncbi:MAG: glycosyltransferase family 4 protein [Lachnospiraceae bacterium]|nr:glycosyltransferase family 4 protein [Lachnospiraceae bacterium]MCM1237866.1 glycosyltransferase family 4 protein [Lachnospiraceae bacterium]
MNILFMTLLDFDNIDEHNIYTDLLRKFYNEGHGVYVISPVERRRNIDTYCLKVNDRLSILKLKIGNTQKINIIEKGISTITLEHRFISGIKKFFTEVRFDLVLYSTPPITLQKAVEYVKRKDNAVTYLMLKDIFPQNAVDMCMLHKNGIRGILYRYFRNKEEKLYRDSDYIGCMSENNVKFLLKHNPGLKSDKVEICPNAIEPMPNVRISDAKKEVIKKRYDIPTGKLIFLYGGNLGRPQGVDFLLQVIDECEESDCFFLIVGNGTEYQRMKTCIDRMDTGKVKLMNYLPKEEYEEIVNISDVGLVFLDGRFTVPNIPSRMLSYMQASVPMLAATDESTDIKRIFEENHMGMWCRNGNAKAFFKHMEMLKDQKTRKTMGENGRKYLEEHCTVQICYDVIMRHMKR